jgi:hypothetical protein
MSDDILNDFVQKLIVSDLFEEEFKDAIENFSKFLNYTNPNYKYNGTYLSQYTDDYINMIRMLKSKDVIYNKILMKLIMQKRKFELLIDNVYYASYSCFEDIQQKYISLDKNKIMGKELELKITFSLNEKEYIYFKKYINFESKQLINEIVQDIKKYIKLKKIRSEYDELEGFYTK